MDIDKLITEALDKVNKEIENSRIGKILIEHYL